MLTFHQNYVTLILAFFFGLLIFFSAFIWHGPDLLARMIYGSALFLLARDVIAGVAISRGLRVFSNPNRWVYAFYHALYFGIFMMLFNWQGPAGITQLAIGATIGAVLFASIMSFMYYGKDHEYKHHFDTENAAANGKFWRGVFYFWPILTIVLLIFLARRDFSMIAAFFAPLLAVGFLMPQFSRVKKGSYIWTNLPRIVGFALLIVTPIMTYIGASSATLATEAIQLDLNEPQPIYPPLSP